MTIKIVKLSCSHEREEGQMKATVGKMYCCRECHNPRIVEEIVTE